MTSFTDASLRPKVAKVAAAVGSVVGLVALFAFAPTAPMDGVSKVSVFKAKTEAKYIAPKESLALAAQFEAEGYTLDKVRSGQLAVPYITVAELPKDIGYVRDSALRKSLFFRALLPMTLQVNAEIEADHVRLERIRDELSRDGTLYPWDQDWLEKLAAKYKVSADNFDKLDLRVRPLPVSLVLAQAAIESGWGTSRFAREGNALFGQWTWSTQHKGIVPANRGAGKTHRIRAFDTAKGAIEAYALNLNTHKAYTRLREQRAHGASGYALTMTLDKYSELGMRYVQELRALINKNDLKPLDHARLQKEAIVVSR